MLNSVLMLHLIVVPPLLLDDIPTRQIFLTDIDRGSRLVCIDDLVKERNVPGRIILDTFDEASILSSTTLI